MLVREPTHVAQSLATLDQLSGGRVEAAIGLGGESMLDAHAVDRGQRPTTRLREALQAMRTLLAEGELTYDGAFHRYQGLTTLARPVQERLPLLVAGMVGPRSFRLAGEVGDGVHAAGCTPGYSTYVVEQVRQGAERSGRDWRDLDLASWCITSVAEESTAAREAARGLVAGWLGQLPMGLLERHGLDPAEVVAIISSLHAGDTAAAVELVTNEMVDALALAGTPEECVDAIRTRLIEPGIDHVVMGITDPDLVEAIAGTRPVGAASVREQLQLIRDRVAPALADPQQHGRPRAGSDLPQAPVLQGRDAVGRPEDPAQALKPRITAMTPPAAANASRLGRNQRPSRNRANGVLMAKPTAVGMSSRIARRKCSQRSRPAGINAISDNTLPNAKITPIVDRTSGPGRP